MDTTSFEDFTNRLEHMLLFQLTLNMENGRLSLEEGKEIAKAFLKIKATTKEELLQGLITIGNAHGVIQPTIAKFSEEFDHEFQNNVLSKMHTSITQGDIDSAIKIGKLENQL